MQRPTYDGAHKRARRDAIRDLHDGDPCCRCGGPMYRALAHLLDLDHDDTDPTRYRGLAHRRCNRRAGAIKGNKARGQTKRQPRIWQSRAW